jgi:DNA-binding NarL/FixJ family response regulator
MAQPYRILLAEDHVIFRETIKKGLEEVPGLQVVGEVGDGLELPGFIEKLAPHLVILDIGLPRMSGLEAAKQIKQTRPEIKIIVLTMHKSKEHLHWAMEAGIDGYLLKDNAFKDLMSAIEAVREGKSYISPLVTDKVVEVLFRQPRSKPQGNEILTIREKEVLQSLAEGKSNKEIAAALSISESTVRVHLKKIKEKLHIKSNVDLVRYAFKHGYASVT